MYIPDVHTYMYNTSARTIQIVNAVLSCNGRVLDLPITLEIIRPLSRRWVYRSLLRQSRAVGKWVYKEVLCGNDVNIIRENINRATHANPHNQFETSPVTIYEMSVVIFVIEEL